MHIALGAIQADQRVWILDVEDEYGRLIPLLPEGSLVALAPDQLRFNFVQPPGPWIAPASWLDEVELLLRGEGYLRDGSLNVFRTGMGRLLAQHGVTAGGSDWPSLHEVIAFFGGMSFGPKSRSAGFVESLLNRLGRLADAYHWTAGVTGSAMLSSLADRSVIFRLHTLTGTPLQFLVSFLLPWLTRYREGRPAGGPIHLLLLIEEPHMLISDPSRLDISESALCRTFRTGRKRDLALLLCDQVPSQLPPPILGNLGCRIVMRLVSSPCIR